MVVLESTMRINIERKSFSGVQVPLPRPWHWKEERRLPGPVRPCNLQVGVPFISSKCVFMSTLLNFISKKRVICANYLNPDSVCNKILSVSIFSAKEGRKPRQLLKLNASSLDLIFPTLFGPKAAKTPVWKIIRRNIVDMQGIWCFEKSISKI